MPYTLWSQGRLLGESELECAHPDLRSRIGAFWPTVVGAKVMSIIVGVSSAMATLSAKQLELELELDEMADADRAARVEQLTEYADYAAAVDRLRALELELRDEKGAVVATESLELRESDFLADLVRRELELDDMIADEATSDHALPDDGYSSDADEELDIERELARLSAATSLEEEQILSSFDSSVNPPNGATPSPPFALYQLEVTLASG